MCKYHQNTDDLACGPTRGSQSDALDREESTFRGWGRMHFVHNGNIFFSIKGRYSGDVRRDYICSVGQLGG